MEEYISDKDLGSLVSFLKHEKDPWGVKDLDSRFVYVNNLSHLGINNDFNIEGLLDRELPHPVAELASELIMHDSGVIDNKQKTSVIQTALNFNENKYKSYFFEKRPFYNKHGSVIGTIYHGREFIPLSIDFLFGNKNASVCRFEPPNNSFTKRECSIIFWLIRRLSSKEIGKKLEISHRTVENTIQAIYNKSGVNDSHQFREYCSSIGFDNYIPIGIVSPYITINMD